MITTFPVATRYVRLSSALVLLACALALSGCHRAEPRYRVSGNVTLLGQPFSKGLVLFRNMEKEVHATALVNDDGTYAAKTLKGEGLPVGTYEVCVAPPKTLGFGGDVVDLPKARPGSNIPPKYRDPKTSGLTLTVTEGDNRFDIAM